MEPTIGTGPGLVIACGGTGGHLFPGLAVAEAWTAQGGRALLLISEKEIDRQAAKKYTQYQFATVPMLPKPATWSPRMLPFLWQLWRTLGRCRVLLGEFRARAVLGMGGFTSLPPVQAGRKLGMATFIHDSNAVPGRANRLTARWCDEILLGLKEAQTWFPGMTCQVTGTPIRGELRELPPRQEAAKKWGLDPGRPVVLVMGGSQGARRLNELIAEASLAPGVQVLHIAGPLEEKQVAERIGTRPDYKVLGFCEDMGAAYAVADLVVARSGASSLTELAYLGLPSILIPLPWAADDHQTANARVFATAGAARLAQQREIDSALLSRWISEMLDPTVLGPMRAKAASLAVPDAASRVVAEIMKRIQKG